MNDRILHNLGFARKFLLTAAAALAIAIPVAFGLFHPTPGRAQEQSGTATSSTPTYSSVSIKPSLVANGEHRTQMMFSLMDGSFVARGVTLQKLMQIAYHLQAGQISGPEDFLTKKKFDIEAKLDPAYVAAMHQQGPDKKNFDDQGMLKSLLENQFKLVTHFETRSIPTYDLVAAEGGTKLQPYDGQQRRMHFAPGELDSLGTPLDLLAAELSSRLGRPVVDKTGLKGIYSFNLHWTPDPSEEANLRQSGEMVPLEPTTDQNGPSLTSALEEQLGLALQPNTDPIQVLVIDHVEQPAEN